MCSSGIVSGRKRANSAEPTAAYFALIVLDEGIIVLEINQLHLDVWWWAFYVNSRWIVEQLKAASCASKSANCHRKSAASFLIFWANGALGNTLESFSFMVLQLGKWLKFSSSIGASHRVSLALNAFTLLYISEMIWSRPCSCKFIAFRWPVVSLRKAVSHKNLRSLSCVVSFPEGKKLVGKSVCVFQLVLHCEGLSSWTQAFFSKQKLLFFSKKKIIILTNHWAHISGQWKPKLPEGNRATHKKQTSESTKKEPTYCGWSDH